MFKQGISFNFSAVDFGVFIGYILFLSAIGLWFSFKEQNKTAKDYFLASGVLPWWAIGGSLIASNISAEQFIGMSGSGYKIGMAIASYEFMAAITLVLIAKFFLPVFIKEKIYTMPQFIEQRFNKKVATFLAFFWVLLFVFVNISTVLYLGALALQNVMGVPIFLGILGLVLFSATFSIFGGLKAVVWTDAIQVVVLIFGGLLASFLVLDAVGGGVFEGFKVLMEKAPEKFSMILSKGELLYPTKDGMRDAYNDLPGISVLIGGMWIANIYYWGTNQYIIQRALGAKNIAEAQKGTLFAAFLKILLPIIVVIPGIAAYVLNADIAKADEAYPWVLNNYVTVGFKGLAFAALIAAIGSSISSMVNSASTIFTLDIYKNLSKKERTQSTLVKVGKLAALGALILGALIAPLLGNVDQAFQFIQKYTGFISPGVVVVFLFGMFWKRTSANAALWTVIASFVIAILLDTFASSIPFMNAMCINFVILCGIIISISMFENKEVDSKAIPISSNWFETSRVFNIGAMIILFLLSLIYVIWW